MRRGLKNIGILLLVLMAGALFAGCGFHYSFSFGNGGKFLDEKDAKEFTIEKTATDPITSIRINTRIADVELIQSDNYYVEIDYLYWEEEPEYSIKGGKLTFDDRDALPDSYSINFDLHNIIKVYLPKEAAMNNIKVEDASGDVFLSGFTADDLEAEVSYGNFTLKEATAGKADISLSSGRSEISDFEVGKLVFKNSYGNADFTNINTGDALPGSDVVYDRVDINMSSGNVDINGLKVKSLELENSYGNVTCKDITAETFQAELNSGDLRASKADLGKTEVDNSYGDVILELTGAKEDYALDLDTSYGNIRVDDENYDDHAVLDNGGARSVTADLSSGDVEISFE